MPSANENQTLFLNQLITYLSMVAHERPTAYRPDEVHTRLNNLTKGHCSGLVALWLYYKRRSKEQYFYNSIMHPILSWDSTKETLSPELAQAMEYALSAAVSLQGMDPTISGMTAYSEMPWEEASVQQTDYDVLIGLMKQDDYPDIRKEYEIAFVFTNNELKELLEEFPADKLIRLASGNHAIGLFFDGHEYVLFDPNGFIDEQTKERFFEKRFAANDVENLIKNIQSAFQYEAQSNVTGLEISVFDDANKPMPIYPDRVKRTRKMLYDRAQQAGGMDIDIANAYDSASALWFCARAGHLDMVKLLLSRGAQPNKMVKIKGIEMAGSDVVEMNSIHIASQNGHSSVLEALLASNVGKGLVNTPMRDGQTPLYIAAKQGHVEVVKLLLNRGGQIDPKAKIKTTSTAVLANPIHVKAKNGHWAVLDVILNSNTGKELIDAPTIDGDTPLELAVKQGHIAVVKLLLSRGATIDADVINIASTFGRAAIVELFLDFEVGRKLLIEVSMFQSVR